MTEAQGVELIGKLGDLVTHVAKIRDQLDFLGNASAFCFLALCAILFFSIVGALRKS